MVAQTTEYQNSTFTQYRTITSTPTATAKPNSNSSKSRDIGIGVGVGVGVPVLFILSVLLLLLYRRRRGSQVQNYVDSNGNETGLAVTDGWLTRTMRHFHNDDNNLDEDAEEVVKEALSSETERGFVVDRPRPLRVLNGDDEHF